MMRKLILFYIVITTANLAFLKSAIASDLCTFSQSAPGALVTEGGRPKRLVTYAAAGGSPTQMSATCTQAANISVSAPIQVTGPEFTPVSAVAIVTIPSGSSTKTGDAPLSLPAGTTPLTIDFAIDRGRSLRAGNYSYTVKFTVMP